MTPVTTGRRYDLDWLRIGAFGLLILYHIGMVFVPWEFHIKTAAPQRWLEPVMMLSNAWRLSLLFLISGVASRAMLARDPGPGRFARGRTARLAVPLVAGMMLWVPPQAWVDITVNHGYRAGFGWFWTHDYFRFDEALGVALPTWNHLWFVAYLWVYTLLLALLLMLPAAMRAAAQRGFDRLFGGWWLVAVPTVYIATVRIGLADRFPETHGLTDDWCAHLIYGAAFLFGFGLGPGGAPWAVIARVWRPCLVAGIIGGGIVAGVNWSLAADTVLSGGPLAALRVARAVQAWGFIIGLIGLAQAHWQRDHRWRATLVEAVFPAYIAHQTVLIVVMYWLRPLGWSPLPEFVVLLAATMAGCTLFYLVGRRWRWLRPLVGLGPLRQPPIAPSWASSQALRVTPPA
ncbi:acyltransferase family protein [Sandarakinorhabdus sp. DWP1-3-1]|uniref:acyltransferase family protein n=1 Tax=Sandarakinorhabdus sp. DWP1-3-1 TaxID=2804627 RepID=UPI003CF13A13